MGVLLLRRRAGAGVYQLLCLGPQGHAIPRFVRRVLACLRSSTHHLQGCSGQPWPGQSLFGLRGQPLGRPSRNACLWHYSLGSVPQHTIAVSVSFSWPVRRHGAHFVGSDPGICKLALTGACLALCRRTMGTCQLIGSWTRSLHTGGSPQAMASGACTQVLERRLCSLRVPLTDAYAGPGRRGRA